MRIQEVRSVAKTRGVISTRMGKPDLIRSIQRAEGSFARFGSAEDIAINRAVSGGTIASPAKAPRRRGGNPFPASAAGCPDSGGGR